jgi:hypothetical protein
MRKHIAVSIAAAALLPFGAYAGEEEDTHDRNTQASVPNNSGEYSSPTASGGTAPEQSVPAAPSPVENFPPEPPTGEER